jgi:hypothetical protein
VFARAAAVAIKQLPQADDNQKVVNGKVSDTVANWFQKAGFKKREAKKNRQSELAVFREFLVSCVH